MTSATANERRWNGWRSLRGGCIAFVLLGHVLAAIPVPDRANETIMASKDRQRDVDIWVDALGVVGLQPERSSIEGGIISFTNLAADTDAFVRAPWKPIFQVTRTGQAWALFAGTSDRHDRLVIQLLEEGTWRDLYRRQDPDADWLDSMFRFRRVRGVYDTSGDRMTPGYRHFSKWIIRRALIENPDARRGRLFLERATVATPWEPDAQPRPERRLVRVHRRRDLLGPKPAAP